MTIPFRSTVPARASERASSLPFHWEAADGSLDALSGQVGAFSSPLGGAAIGANGGLALMGNRHPRWEVVADLVTGAQRLGLLVEPTHINLVVRSEDFSAGWSDIGTPPAIVAGAVLAGALSLTTLGDADGGALEGKSQVVAFTADATKYVALFVAQGTATSSVVRLRDTSAGANRLLAAITWSDGVPVVAMTTGTFVGQRALANGVYELRFLTAAVTAANTNQIEIYPATDAALATAATGTLHAGGVSAYNLSRAVNYIRTLGATASAGVDVLQWDFALPRRRVWMYLAFTNLGAHVAPVNATGYASLGGVTGTGIGIYQGSGGYGAFHTVAGAGALLPLAGSYATFGQLVEVLVTMDAAGVPTIHVAKDGGAVATQAGGSAPADMTTPPTAGLVRLGTFDDGTTYTIGAACYHALKIGEYGLGTPTLAQARGYR